MKIPDHLPAQLKPLPPLPLWRLAYNFFRRQIGCRLSFHDTRPSPDGRPPNFCGYGCGTQLNPRAYATYAVSLKDGTRHVVQAVTAHHALNLVIYGEKNPSLAMARQVIKVHPANIADVVRIEA